MILNNQYYMYGIIVSYDWYENWKKTKGISIDEFILKLKTDTITPITVDDISTVFYGRNGKSIIIGKIIENFENVESLVINELSTDKQEEIKASVYENYGLSGEFNHYFIKSFYSL